MEKAFKIALILNAVDRATAPVRAVIRANQDLDVKLKAMETTARKSDATLKSIDGFRTLKTRTVQASAAWEKATADVKRLAMAIRAAEKPSKELQTAFDAAKTRAARLKNEHRSLSERTERLRRTLAAAGISTRKLSEGERRLRSEAAATATALDKQRSALDKLSASERRRGGSGGATQRLAYAGLAGQSVQQIGQTVSGLFTGPVREAMVFEEAMAGVIKVVDFADNHAMKAFEERLTGMSTRIPIAAAGLAEIAASGGQLGILEQDLDAFVETTAKMATAFDMLPAEAGEASAKLSNVYQIPIAKIGELGDAVNHLSDNTAAKAGDIVRSLGRIGGTARQFGLLPEQAAALSGAMIALGKPPEVAATGINALLLKMQTATKQGDKFQEALAFIGWTAEDLESAIADDAQGALTEFLRSVEDVDSQDRAGVLSELFGLEYADDIALLVGSLDQYEKALGLVGNQASYAGSMQREFENRSKTTANALQLLDNKWSNTKRAMAEDLLPVLRDLMDMAGRAATTFGNWAREYPQLTKWVVLGAGALAALAFVLAPIITMVTALAPLFALLSAPVLAVAAAIAATALGAWMLYKNFEPVMNWFSNMWEYIKALFWGGVASVLEAVQPVLSMLPDFALPEWMEEGKLQQTIDRTRKLADVTANMKPVEFYGYGDLADDIGLGSALSGPQLNAAGGPMTAMAQAGAGASNTTVHNSITVNPSAGQSPEEIARAIMREQERLNREALHD